MPVESTTTYQKESELPPYWLSNKPIMKTSSSFGAFPKPPSYNGNGYNHRVSDPSVEGTPSASPKRDTAEHTTVNSDIGTSSPRSSIEEAVVHVSSKPLISPKVNTKNLENKSESKLPAAEKKKPSTDNGMGFQNPGFVSGEDLDTKSSSSSGVGSVQEEYDLQGSKRQEDTKSEDKVVTSAL